MTTQFKIIFEGKTIPGQDVGSVKKRLKALLKTDAQGISQLFSGKPVVIRKNVDVETAEKFRIEYYNLFNSRMKEMNSKKEV